MVRTAAAVKEKPKQQPLPGKDFKPTPLETASRDLLVAREELEVAQKKVETMGAAMIQTMKESGRIAYNVEGYTISVDTVAAREKLKVKKLEQY